MKPLRKIEMQNWSLHGGEDNDFPTRKLANRPEDRNQKASVIHGMWNIPHHITLALIKAQLLKIIHNGSKSGQCVARTPNKTEKENEKRDFVSSTCAMKMTSKYFGKEKGGAQSYGRACMGKHRLCDEMFDQMFV